MLYIILFNFLIKELKLSFKNLHILCVFSLFIKKVAVFDFETRMPS